MASAISSKKLSSNLKVYAYDVDPDGSDATDVAWVDLKGYDKFMAVYVRTVGTGDLDAFSILANTTSDGGNTDVEVKAHAIGSQPNASGDFIFLECTAAEVKQLGDSLRYVSASTEHATSTDEGVVVYIYGGPTFAKDGLTTDVIS